MTNDRITLDCMDEWVDFDSALFRVGRALGVFPRKYEDLPNAKAVLWSKNPINDCLSNILDELVRIGYIEHDENTLRFRLRKGFVLNVPE